MASRQLSHHEVWDDSALVSSWNEALEEYKKYHSLAAKGERVEEILDAVEKEEEVGATNAEVPIDETTGLPPWQSNDSNDLANGHEPTEEVHTTGNQTVKPPPPQQSAAAPTGLSVSMPQALLNSTQDENLKNLMMSWYYAGYYTGLQEGQQKALAAQQDAAK